MVYWLVVQKSYDQLIHHNFHNSKNHDLDFDLFRMIHVNSSVKMEGLKMA